MPSSLAALIFFGFIAYLLRMDARQEPKASGALWLPVIWVFIISSRALSQWLFLFGINTGGITVEEGSTTDAIFYTILIVLGLRCLIRRGVTLGAVIQENRWLAVFLLYGLISLVWSDFPLVGFKRWFKSLGHFVMVLIVLTEDDPLSAFRHLMKRCAFALLPLSVLLIKYFPQFGRTFSEFTGVAQNSGAALNKNGLGCICMIFGLFFVWHLATIWRNYALPSRRREIQISLAFLGIIAWLFVLAPSSTALLCFLVASAVVLYLGRANVTPSRLGGYTVMVVLTLGAAEMFFGISNLVLVLTGKSATLTGRTDLWHDILQIKVNRLVGAGYESFWLGSRLQSLWDIYWWRPNQAHNGYLETYLNLGIIGVAFLAGLIFVAFRKCSQAVVEQPEFGRFRFGFLFLALLYNWPEAAFRGLHVVLFIFYLIAMDSPFRSARRVTAEEYDWEEPRGEPTLGYA